MILRLLVNRIENHLTLRKMIAKHLLENVIDKESGRYLQE